MNPTLPRGDTIRWEDIPNGTRLGGMAPIGIRWGGTKWRGRKVADKPCPNGEFLVISAWIDGRSVEVTFDTPEVTRG